MKAIDLLNRIAKDEGIPIKIKFKDKTWEWNSEFYDYKCIDINHKYLVEDLETEDLNRTCEEIPLIEEDKKDEEIELYFNGKKVDITDIYEPLKQGEYFYKENGKWYAHRLKNVTFEVEEDKKDKEIERLNNIIKEVREYINKIPTQPVIRVFKKELLELLDKANKEE